jgi:preprotein translocase subunit SecG
MSAIVLVIHMILAISIIGLVLLQRSESGGLGGLGGGNMGGLATAQGATTALTRVTWWCAAGFFITSLALAVLTGSSARDRSISDKLQAVAIEAPAVAGSEEVDSKASSEKAPSVPVAE